MKKFFYIFIFLFLCTGCLLNNRQAMQEVTKKFSTLKINDYIFDVELANTLIKQYQGLSDRQSLPENQGMLFVFNDYQNRDFAMRAMRFPLDIVWIKDNQVLGCDQNIAIQNSDGTVPQVTSPAPVNYILEIKANRCHQLDIKAGDRVDIKIN